MSQKNENNVKISIGLPIYNGERFLRAKLDSLLTQTYKNFELIVSNNGSTDKTHEICNEYAIKDNRIRYFSHDKNNDAFWNFNFVLQEARCKYFMWSAVDDILLPTFIEKNIRVLESDKTIIGSISDVELYKKFTDESKPDITDPLNRNTKKFQYVHPTSGSFEKRVKFYLRFFQASIIYGIYRTEKMKESFIQDNFWAIDLAIILNLLRYGNLHVVDEILMYRYIQDKPSKSIIQYQLKYNIPLVKIIFLEFPFTIWFLKNFDFKIFIKNIHIFVKLNLRGEYVVFSETVRIIKRIIFRQDKFW